MGSESVVDVQGTVEDGYEPVRDAFAANFAERGERGAAVTVYRDGRKVVDLRAGTKDGDADPDDATAAPWEPGTAQVVRSATKGIAATVPLLLHQRGQLDLDAPVGTYWPEFKAAGRTASWSATCSRTAPACRPWTPAHPRPGHRRRQRPGRGRRPGPAWTPGTDHGYHAQTYSWLLGELVLRVTGRTLGAWVAEEISRPLDLDLWIGLPDEARPASAASRPSSRRPAPPPPACGSAPEVGRRRLRRPGLPHQPRLRRDLPGPRRERRRLPRRRTPRLRRHRHRPRAGPRLRRTDRPGRRPPAALRAGHLTLARTEESAGPDRTLLVNTRFGLGFMLHGPASPLLGPGSFGHPGRGGALAFADPESGIAFGYVTNGMQRNVTADPRAQALVRAVAAVAAVGG
ncbi:serine hydrolase [Streptomyces noursei]|nr:serine hydrolase [Streptomyces noursei]